MIQVRGLSYTYPKSKEEAVKAIDFDIKKGEIFGFLGPSGAGKSTTQKILIKMLDGYVGEVKVFGQSIDTFGSEYFERVGVGFELPNHFSKLTASENLAFFNSFYKKKHPNPDALLQAVGLLEHKDKRVNSFSKGMKMRLNFARALLNNADILFFDEPTSGLDPVNAKLIMDLIEAQQAQGKTIFITTHAMNVAETLCDRVAFMVDGRIAEIGSPKELKMKYGKREVQVVYEKAGKKEEASFSLETYGTDQAFLHLIANHKTHTIHSMETTLEEVFIKVTGRELV